MDCVCSEEPCTSKYTHTSARRPLITHTQSLSKWWSEPLDRRHMTASTDIHEVIMNNRILKQLSKDYNQEQ